MAIQVINKPYNRLIAASNFGNSNISDCVLEAPNGVLEYNNNILTLKAGVKFLISDGTNKNRTLKSIERIIPQDISHTLADGEQAYHVFYYDELKSIRGWGGDYIESENEPPLSEAWQYIMWRNPVANEYKQSNNGSAYRKVSCIRLGGMLKEAGSPILSINPVEPISLLKRSDKSEITSWSMPSDKKIPLTLGPASTKYRAPAVGFFNIWARGTTAAASYMFANVYNRMGELKYIIPVDIPRNLAGAVPTLIHVDKDDYVVFNYQNIGTVEVFNFIYAKGAL